MKVFLMGCGRIAERHANSIKELSNSHPISLVGACDIVEEKSLHFCDKHNIDSFTSIASGIHSTKPDIVSILTESGNHARHAEEVIRMSVSVAIEKPASLSARDFERLCSLADQYNVHVFTIKQNRFNRPVKFLRQLVDEKRLGDLLMVTSRVRWMRTEEYYKQASWRGTYELDGGVVSNQASHHLDMMVWFGGRVKRVNSISRRFMAPIECEDTAIAMLEFESGAVGAFEATTCTRYKDLEGSISVLGTRGSCVIDGFAMNHLQSLSFESQQQHPSESELDISTNPPNVYGFGHTEFYLALCNRMKIGDKHRSLVEGREALHMIQVMNAVYKSAKTNDWVEASTENDYFNETINENY